MDTQVKTPKTKKHVRFSYVTTDKDFENKKIYYFQNSDFCFMSYHNENTLPICDCKNKNTIYEFTKDSSIMYINNCIYDKKNYENIIKKINDYYNDISYEHIEFLKEVPKTHFTNKKNYGWIIDDNIYSISKHVKWSCSVSPKNNKTQVKKYTKTKLINILQTIPIKKPEILIQKEIECYIEKTKYKAPLIIQPTISSNAKHWINIPKEERIYIQSCKTPEFII